MISCTSESDSMIGPHLLEDEILVCRVELTLEVRPKRRMHYTAQGSSTALNFLQDFVSHEWEERFHFVKDLIPSAYWGRSLDQNVPNHSVWLSSISRKLLINKAKVTVTNRSRGYSDINTKMWEWHELKLRKRNQ